MKHIWVFDEDVKQELVGKGLKIIQETMIGDKKAYIFANQKDVFLNKYTKDQIMLSNKLFF